MVNRREQRSSKTRGRKEFCANRAKAIIINASTVYQTCSEQLSPFGGVLPLVKFFDLVGFRKIFHSAYHAPVRQPKLGHTTMMIGIVILMFIGFNRLRKTMDGKTRTKD